MRICKRAYGLDHSQRNSPAWTSSVLAGRRLEQCQLDDQFLKDGLETCPCCIERLSAFEGYIVARSFHVVDADYEIDRAMLQMQPAIGVSI
jgi:hypothetical protein